MMTYWLYNLVLGVFATLGFAVWFSMPRRALPAAAGIGAVGFLVRRALLDAGGSLPLSTLWAATLIGLLGLVCARRFNTPRVVFTVTAIIPLIPGAAAYKSLERFSAGDIGHGSESMLLVLLVVLAIAGGLTLARAVIAILPSAREE